MQSDVAGVCMEDGNNSGSGVPGSNVFSDELKVDIEAGRSPSNDNALILKATFASVSVTGISMCSGLIVVVVMRWSPSLLGLQKSSIS